MYSEDDFLMLSGIQHFAFCRRQWALLSIEQQWAENLLTTEGHFLHDRVHDESIMESRGDVFVSRGMPVHSSSLGLSGQCDAVEFYRDDLNGIPIHGRDGKWRLSPVEYKHGISKYEDMDRLQLCAQAISLEEMFVCQIPCACLFYGMTKKREEVPLTEELRTKTKNTANEMHTLFLRGHVPMVKPSKACLSCSLKDLCLPVLYKKQSVAVYIENSLKDSVCENF